MSRSERLLQHLPDTSSKSGDVVRDALQKLGFVPAKQDEIKEMIAGVIQSSDLPPNFATIEKKHRYIMGVLMEKLVGRAEGGTVAKLLHDELSTKTESVEPATD